MYLRLSRIISCRYKQSVRNNSAWELVGQGWALSMLRWAGCGSGEWGAQFDATARRHRTHRPDGSIGPDTILDRPTGRVKNRACDAGCTSVQYRSARKVMDPRRPTRPSEIPPGRSKRPRFLPDSGRGGGASG